MLRTPARLPLPPRAGLVGCVCRGRTLVFGGSRSLRPRIRVVSLSHRIPGALSRLRSGLPAGSAPATLPPAAPPGGPPGLRGARPQQPRSPAPRAPERRDASLPPQAPSRAKHPLRRRPREQRRASGLGHRRGPREMNSQSALTAKNAPSPRRGEMKVAGRIPRSPRNSRFLFSDPEPRAARPRASPARRALPPAGRAGLQGSEAPALRSAAPSAPHVHSP